MKRARTYGTLIHSNNWRWYDRDFVGAWLQKAGCKIVIIDTIEPGTGVSHSNAGCFNGSSVVPMSMRGMWTNVPRWLMDPLTPLAIPRLHAHAISMALAFSTLGSTG